MREINLPLGFERKCPFCKESLRKVNKKQQLLISCSLRSCEYLTKNIVTNADDQKLVYGYGFPQRKSVITTMSIGIYISSLIVKTPGHCHSWLCLHQHIFIHLNTSLINPCQNPLFAFMSSFRTSAQTKIYITLTFLLNKLFFPKYKSTLVIQQKRSIIAKI